MAKERKLTKAEEKRLQLFNKLSERLEQNGYIKKDLTVSVEKANVLGAIYGIVLAIPFAVVYFLVGKGGRLNLDNNFFIKWIALIVVMFLLIVVHELIHGFTWSLFAKKRFKSIEFGIIWKMLTPYCTCKEPLRKIPYITGGLMPCLVLGVIPCIISWFNHNVLFLLMGVFMIMGAGGDLLICKMILDKKTKRPALYLDHPTDVGLAMFVKRDK